MGINEMQLQGLFLFFGRQKDTHSSERCAKRAGNYPWQAIQTSPYLISFEGTGTALGPGIAS